MSSSSPIPKGVDPANSNNTSETLQNLSIIDRGANVNMSQTTGLAYNDEQTSITLSTDGIANDEVVENHLANQSGSDDFSDDIVDTVEHDITLNDGEVTADVPRDNVVADLQNHAASLLNSSSQTLPTTHLNSSSQAQEVLLPHLSSGLSASGSDLSSDITSPSPPHTLGERTLSDQVSGSERCAQTSSPTLNSGQVQKPANTHNLVPSTPLNSRDTESVHGGVSIPSSPEVFSSADAHLNIGGLESTSPDTVIAALVPTLLDTSNLDTTSLSNIIIARDPPPGDIGNLDAPFLSTVATAQVPSSLEARHFDTASSVTANTADTPAAVTASLWDTSSLSTVNPEPFSDSLNPGDLETLTSLETVNPAQAAALENTDSPDTSTSPNTFKNPYVAESTDLYGSGSSSSSTSLNVVNAEQLHGSLNPTPPAATTSSITVETTDVPESPDTHNSRSSTPPDAVKPDGVFRHVNTANIQNSVLRETVAPEQLTEILHTGDLETSNPSDTVTPQPTLVNAINPEVATEAVHTGNSQYTILPDPVTTQEVTGSSNTINSQTATSPDRGNTAEPIESVNTRTSERSTSSDTATSSENQLGGVRLPSSTPPQPTSATPQYSCRQASGAGPSTPPALGIPAETSDRDSSPPITARRQRRTMTTDTGSPVRIAGNQDNNRAPGAPGSPRWRFNIVLRGGPDFAPDATGTQVDPAPARFVAGSRHNSPHLRRVRGSDSLRTLNNEQEPNTPERDEVQGIQEEPAAAAEEPVAAAAEPEPAQEHEVLAMEVNGLLNPAPEPVFFDEEDVVPVYDPAVDDVEEPTEDNDVILDDDDDEAPEAVMFVTARRFLRQVGAEVDILDQIEEAALVRGSGAAVRARAALLFAEEELTLAVRAAVQAIEHHRTEARRLAHVARALRAEGLVARERALANAASLEEVRLQLAALRGQTRRNE